MHGFVKHHASSSRSPGGCHLCVLDTGIALSWETHRFLQSAASAIFDRCLLFCGLARDGPNELDLHTTA